MNENGPRIDLLDQNGKFRTSLLANKEGQGLRLLDENGVFRAGLARTDTGSVLSLSGEKSELLIVRDGSVRDLCDKSDKPSETVANKKLDVNPAATASEDQDTP